VASEREHHLPWKAPILAFFSKDLYADVAYKWTGTGIAYLLLLVCLSWLLTVTLTVAVPVVRILSNQELPKFCKQVPKMTITAGRLSIDRKCPYAINDSNGKVVALFVADDQPLKEGHPPVVISSDALEIDVPGVGLKTYQLAPLAALNMNLEIDVDSSFSSVKRLLPWLPLIYVAVGLPIVFLVHLAQMLVYGLVAMLIARAYGCPITYQVGLRLAAVAITPAIILSTAIVVMIFLFFPVQLLHLLIVYAPVHSWAIHHPFAIASVVLAISYLIFGCSTLKARQATNA
jgi:hypothetical protein